MKSVLLSIQPEYCALISSGEKTVEIRKTKPKIKTPFKCYIYCTKPKTINPHEILETHCEGKIYKANGKVIGEFICDDIKWHGNSVYVIREECIKALEGSCLTEEEFHNYMGYPPVNPYQDLKEARKKYEFYGWHISDLVIYDKPKDFRDFSKPCIFGKEGECVGLQCIKAMFTKSGLFDYCGNTLSRPPQSWCYVEELRDDQ